MLKQVHNYCDQKCEYIYIQKFVDVTVPHNPPLPGYFLIQSSQRLKMLTKSYGEVVTSKTVQLH